ncbi:Fe-S cluster assembly sulfur transfer protein SufU [Nesterenkonia flava]|uniref:SUF system NifU family Fe-S cluster assembly protein n=1 Tax=Nesterenkonia flava TaxID=469799 RepID=A0ABU1FTY6_9MICC|nr:SUF system NifU family Fe-S cluster assembly protein [Nesterenkonia flava]MDR5712109.1 SUF system NifU family Fe-S cluster assembly protein [Nesterenkonia flava]
MEQLYQQVILDHSRQRSGEGELEHPDGESFQVNPTCGDECRVKVALEGDTITTLAWSGRGCSISQASLSIMHEMLEGHSLTEAEDLGETFRELMHGRGKELSAPKQEKLEDLSAFTGVARYPARIKCALLGWMALRDALLQAQYGHKEGAAE